MVAFYKKATGKPSITYHEALDEALCYGWIDGVRRGVDEESYTVRFTPRRQGSVWSQVNLKKVKALLEQGRMRPSGLEAFEKQIPANYSFERPIELSGEYLERLQAHQKAWAFWERQPVSYRRPASHWVMSAKREETRERRLRILIDDCLAEVRIKPLRRS